jgi:Protein of unknown function (DUF1579)
MTLLVLAAAVLGCSAPEYHALDFWLGSWDVAGEKGAFAGDNVISPILGGCALRESWTDAEGHAGESLFFYDRALKVWKQVWVTTEGGWKEKAQIEAPKGSLRFQGKLPRQGGVVLDRTTLTPLADGRVRQVIEQSKDDGATWTKWEGLYSRRKPQCSTPEHRQMDFWLGDWDALVRSPKAPGSEEWLEARGSNHITRGDNGCSVVEDFHAAGPSQPWTGRSVSQFSPRQGKWRQTWVDESNAYLAFTGGPEGKDFALYGEAFAQKGVERQMRMVFSNIRADAFSWRWEATTDGGKTWSPQILIEYTRHKP